MLGAAALGAGGLGWRLFDWHVQQSAELTARGSSALLARTDIHPRRGSIYERAGNVMAISRGASRIVADPQIIHARSDPFAYADLARRFVDLDPLLIAERVGDPKTRYAVLQRGTIGSALERVSRAIDEGELPATWLEPERVRVYPNQELAAHVLGFVAESGRTRDGVVGQAGVEAWYEDALGGAPGRVSSDLDRLGRRIPTGRHYAVPPRHGSHVILTLDRTLQYIAEQELDAALERYSAEAGTIVMLDPSSGEVLAMASRPAYEPGRVHEYRALGPEFANRATGLIHEPGSTFKLITMAAGLDTGAVRPDTSHELPGIYKYYGQEFRNWDERTYPSQTMVSVLRHSSNTGAIFVADRMGADQFYKYVDAFGFGRVTGIDIAGEVAGIVRRRGDDGWFLPDLAANSFGQGISVTAVQLAAAVGAIANGGVLMRPHVARSIVHPDGTRETIKPHGVRRVVSAESARTLVEMLESAGAQIVNNPASVPGYRTAGKTGTAEIASGGRFLSDTSIASYVGFGPLERPRALTLVTIEKPQTAFFGSEVASPTFKRVMARAFAHLKTPPRLDR